MEKKVRFLSILSTILLLVFFITMFIAAGISMNGEEDTSFKIMYYISNVFMYLAPVSFLISFGLGIYTLVKRKKEKEERKAGKRSYNGVMFPTAWFIVSSAAFFIILLFIIFVFQME